MPKEVGINPQGPQTSLRVLARIFFQTQIHLKIHFFKNKIPLFQKVIHFFKSLKKYFKNLPRPFGPHFQLTICAASKLYYLHIVICYFIFLIIHFLSRLAYRAHMRELSISESAKFKVVLFLNIINVFFQAELYQIPLVRVKCLTS